MSDRRSSAVLWVTLVVVVGLTAILLSSDTTTNRLDPRSVSEDGAKGLVDLVESFGAEVRLGVSVPAAEDAVAVLLADNFGIDGRAELRRWVEAGATLLVADPRSPLTPAEGGDPGSPDCAVGALSGVSRVSGAQTTYTTPTDATACFSGTVIVDPVGDGFIVSLAGPEPLLNAQLDEADNSVLAVALLAPQPGTKVAFLEPRLALGNTGDSLASLVPDWAWVIIIQLGVAFLIVAWWQARRLGAPVVEPTLVVIEGSGLVDARGRLLERIRQPGAAANDLRRSTHSQLCRLLGISTETTVEVLARLVANYGQIQPTEVAALLADRPVSTDADFFQLATGLSNLVQTVKYGSAVNAEPASTEAVPARTGDSHDA